MFHNIAHGHDSIPVRVLKLCSSSVKKTFLVLFNDCLKHGTLSDDWKRGNIIQIHKNGNKQLVNNYRPVSLLPICSKIFEKRKFDTIFGFLEENNLSNSSQSGFISGDSCINQPISITHNIYNAYPS